MTDFKALQLLPAGQELEDAIDAVARDIGLWGLSKSFKRTASGDRPSHRRYSRVHTAGLWLLSEYWITQSYPKTSISFEKRVYRVHSEGEHWKSGDDWECWGEGPTLPLAICRMILDVKDG